jgi:hypothetical protein
LANKLAQAKSDRRPVIDAKAMQYLAQAFADGSILVEDQPEIAESLILGVNRTFFDRNSAALCQFAYNQADKFPWFYFVLQGENRISEAWGARGGGYVNEVSEAGAQGFQQHLAEARFNFTNAWNLNPKWPLAPCRMIYVSMGDSGLGEMRLWFDRTVAAQIDYSKAWSDMRWGLRPRWYGNLNSMLAFGEMAIKTGRFDTDVPRIYMDSVSDVESEMQVMVGERIFDRTNIWPHLQELYNGYMARPSQTAWTREGWQSAYAVVAYFAGHYDVARKELEDLHWQPHAWNLAGWGKDLSLFPQEVAAKSGPQAKEILKADDLRQLGDRPGARKIYGALLARSDLDARTRYYVNDRNFTLDIEQRLLDGEWIRFLPSDTNFIGWHVNSGNCSVLPDGSLEVQSDRFGHMLFSRARVRGAVEVRGQFEVVSNTDHAFQAGLIVGVPQPETSSWFSFRMKRNAAEGDVASFSQTFDNAKITTPITLNERTNTFDVVIQRNQISATINGRVAFSNVERKYSEVPYFSEMYFGLGAYNDANSTVIRYQDVEVRLWPGESK